MHQAIKMSIGSIQLFEQEFSCKITTLPKNVFLLGWSAQRKSWLIAPESVAKQHVFNLQVPSTIIFLNNAVLPKLANRTFWMPFCFYDGWRERNIFSENYRWVPPHDLSAADEWRGAPGEIPLLTSTPCKIACFDAHRGDPSALLLPEAHYLSRNHYQDMFADVRNAAVAWDKKLDRAIFCGKNWGECANYFPPLVAGRAHPRHYLQQLVEAQNLPADIRLDQTIPQSAQISYKYLLDVDGYVRTWDAWAWKICSGSVVLSVASPWESFFTRLFKEWEHYVPIANDFSDLADKLAWCAAHDAECHAIAQRGQLRAQEVYALDYVATSFAQQLQKDLIQ